MASDERDAQGECPTREICASNEPSLFIQSVLLIRFVHQGSLLSSF